MLKNLERSNAKRRVARQQPHHAAERPAPEHAAGTDHLPEIEHIVVLMMENHSYDNYLGMLQGRGDGFSLAADHLPLESYANSAKSGKRVRPMHAATTVQKGGVPTQTWNASHIQWDKGALDGFVHSIEITEAGHDAEIPMQFWEEGDLPFYYGLARTFPLATRWFCSCLGPTFPNRRFLIAGTAHGLIDDVTAGLYDEPAAGTIFDLLTAHGISWANYHNKPPRKTVSKVLFGKVGLRIGRLALPVLAGVLPGLEQFVIGTYQFTADMYPRELLRTVNHALPLASFFDSAAKGTLPSFCVVDPDYGNYSEENPQDIQHGEGFSSAVINAVMDGPGWPKTLLVWLYDEHGGYYDHVAPPPAVEPDDVPGTSLAERFPLLRRLPFLKKLLAELDLADAGPRTYDRYGFRVPAVIVSPYARPNYVTDVVYDHTSILKLVEKKWNLPALTRRDAAAKDPLDAVDFDAPPAFLTPPKLPAPAKPWSPAS